MEPERVPQSVQQMTAEQRRALLRRRTTAAGPAAMEIGGASPVRGLIRFGGRVLAVLGVASAFVLAFFQFTGSLRVAMIVVGLMLTYMIAVGRIVEGRADRGE